MVGVGVKSSTLMAGAAKLSVGVGEASGAAQPPIRTADKLKALIWRITCGLYAKSNQVRVLYCRQVTKYYLKVEIMYETPTSITCS